MEQEKLDRLSELTKKAKTPEGLSEEETAERETLRREYINAFKARLENQLNNTVVIDVYGNKKRLKKKTDK